MSQIHPLHLAIVAGLLVGLWVLVRLRRRGSDEPTYLRQVRALVERKDFRRAGEIQLRNGNLQEAFNLFDRGSVHDRASACAEQLGQYERAAVHAEQAGDIERAADLYLRIQDYPNAARLYQRAGRFQAAAESLEKAPTADPAQLAQLWENAFLDVVPKEGEPIAGRALDVLRHAAMRAATCYKQAGQPERAAHFYELAGDEETAHHIRENVPPRAMSQLDQVRDRLLDRLKSAAPTLRPASGTFSLAPAVDAAATPSSDLPAIPDPRADFPLRARASSDLPAIAEVAGDPASTDLPLPMGPHRFDQAVPPAAPAAPEAAAPPAAEGARPAPGSAPTALDNSALRALLDPLEHTPGGPLDALDPDFGFSLAPPAAATGTPVPAPAPAAGAVDRDLIGAVVDEVLQRHQAAEAVSRTGRGLAAEVLHHVVRQGTAQQVAISGSTEAVVGPSATSAPTSVARLEVVHIHEPGSDRTTDVRRESDRYVLRAALGEGGMGVVYRAWDRVLEREVALKFLPHGLTVDPAMLDRFQQEAKAVAQLNHPNIVTVHDFGVLDGRPFICMELVEGDTVAGLLRDSNGAGLPVLDVLEIAEGLLSALAYAHKRGLVHRDIKPANVMRTREGIVKLMDFGIAKVMEPDKTTRIAGTPAYMAPEQMTGKGIDHRTDLFSVGATLYEMLTGHLPFPGLRREVDVHSTREQAPAIPRRLDSLVLSCLAYEPARRPASAEVLLKTVRAMCRQVETYIERESGQHTAVSGRAHTVDAIETQALKALLAQISRPEEPTISTRQVSGIFRAALGDRRPEIRATAVEVYPAPSPEILRQTLGTALEDPDEQVRVAALRRIAGSDDPLLLDLLSQRARNASDTLSPSERQALFDSLARVGRERAVPVLAEVFRRVRRSRRETQSKEVRALIGAATHIESESAAALLKDLEAFQSELGERSGISQPSGFPAAVPSASQPAVDADAAEALPPEVEQLLVDYLRDREAPDRKPS